MADGATTPGATASHDEILRGRPALVLAPHPDDESLGCGALLAAAFAGAGAHVACLTDGAASHPGSRAVPPAAMAALRRAELQAALAALGGGPGDVTFIGAPDGRLVAADDIVCKVIAVADEWPFGVLLIPSPLDPHCDHVAAAAIGAAVVHARPHLRPVIYPVWSRWHGDGAAPVPGGTTALFVAPGAHRDAKAAAIAAHRSQAGHVVTDDPDGFVMPGGFAALFTDEDEVFFVPAPGHRA